MEYISFEAKRRETGDKKLVKAVRNEAGIPAVLYGGPDTVHFSCKLLDVRGLIYTPDFKLAKISIDGSEHEAIVKDVQFHPVTDEIVHIDFLRLQENTPIKVELPVRFTGVSPGVKSGGKLIQSMRRVKVRTTPEFITDELHVDISHVELGQSVRIKDIQTPEGLVVTNSPNTPIASVEVPRALKSAKAAADAEGGEEATEEAAAE